MSRERLRPRLGRAEKFFVPSSPCVGVSIRDFPFSADSSRWRDDVLGLLTLTSSVVVRCQPWFYLRLEAYSFFWLSEEAYGLPRDFVPEHAGPTRLWILTLEPERLKNRRTTARDVIQRWKGSQPTLKLLVVSDVQRRNALLSSRPAKRSPRFSAPALGAPSVVLALWQRAQRRSPGKARRPQRPAWPRP